MFLTLAALALADLTLIMASGPPAGGVAPRAALLDKLQTDLNAASARCSCDPVPIRAAMGAIRENATMMRDAHRIHERDVREALKNLERIERTECFLPEDRVALEGDRVRLMENLDHMEQRRSIQSSSMSGGRRPY